MKRRDFMIKFNFVTNILILFIMVFGGAIWAESNGIWTKAEDVRAGTFGGDEGAGDFFFPETVSAEAFCMENICVTSWNTVAKSSQGCEDNKAVVGFDNNGSIICDYPFAVYG